MDRDEILEQVLEFLRGVLDDEDGETEEAGPDASYVLDSLAVVEVVTFLEERFGRKAHAGASEGIHRMARIRSNGHGRSHAKSHSNKNG